MPYFTQEVHLNKSFIIGLYLNVAVTNLNCGFTIASFNASGTLLQTQKNWTPLEITIITSFGIFGLMLGALFTGKIIPIGRLKAIHLANITMIISVVP